MSAPDFEIDQEQPTYELPAKPTKEKLRLGVMQDQLTRAIQVAHRQQAVIDAAREFVKVLTMLTPKGDGPLFTTTCDDALAVATVNHRYTELSMLLNGEGHAVPPTLNIGTTH